MSASAAIYSVDRQFRKNGQRAAECAKSPSLKCTNEPPLPVDCVGPEWTFVRTYIPLVHGTRQIQVHHDGVDNFVSLESLQDLRDRPTSATHVVKLLPMKIVMQQACCAGVTFLNPLPMAIKDPMFFFAELRQPGAPEQHLALLRASK